MYAILARIGDWLLKGSVRTALTGAGLGVGTSAVMLATANNYVASIQAQAGSLSANMVGLAGLAGVHIGMSMIIGAVIYRMTVTSTFAKLLKKQG